MKDRQENKNLHEFDFFASIPSKVKNNKLLDQQLNAWNNAYNKKWRTNKPFSDNLSACPSGVPYTKIGYGRNFYQGANDYTLANNAAGYKQNPINEYLVNNHVKPLINPDNGVYAVDGIDALQWMYKYYGAKQLDPSQLARAAYHRAQPGSQLGVMPRTIYYTESSPKHMGSFHVPIAPSKNYELGDSDQSVVAIKDMTDLKVGPSAYAGTDLYTSSVTDEQQESLPWRLLYHQALQLHETGHAFNRDKSKFDPKTGEGYTRFFAPLGGDVDETYDEFQKLFAGTYMENPEEYINAMGHAKRYGHSLGLDVFNKDPKIARRELAKTLHRIKNSCINYDELPLEQQRLLRWLDTAGVNHGTGVRKDVDWYKNYREGTGADPSSDHNNPNSKFYMDILKFMTDDTLQGLVHNTGVPSTSGLA